MATPFRHSAGFGKRIEYWIIGNMLKESLDVYLPLVDDDAIDAVIRRANGTFTTVQIKARSRDCVPGDAGLFAAIPHELRDNYWFVFYSERMDTMWIMTSAEFIAEAHQNKNGKNKGKRRIWFNGRKLNKTTGATIEHCKPQFLKYVATNFARLVAIEPNGQNGTPTPLPSAQRPGVQRHRGIAAEQRVELDRGRSCARHDETSR